MYDAKQAGKNRYHFFDAERARSVRDRHESLERFRQALYEREEFGVDFALDDFGTGYSSLTYLKRLPVGILKIDRSFVRDMLHDPDDLAILEGILALAHTFRRRTVAEGIETVAQRHKLLQLGCELGQGFVIAQPMPALAVPHWVRQWKSGVAADGKTQLPPPIDDRQVH